jgi:hypothetical protein
MPPDKAPGLDGFNGIFLKKCWHIVKNNIYTLCDDFYNGTINLECINTSFITLVPKISNPEGVNDFRPISLLNGSLKNLDEDTHRHALGSDIETHTPKSIWVHPNPLNL